MANRIPPDQTLVIQGVPFDKQGMVADALHIQSMSESVVLQSQRSSLLGPLMFVHDKIPGPCPRYLCYANYKDSFACLVGMDSMVRWLNEREWGHQLTLYVKKMGPATAKIMVPADQTLVIKGVTEDKKEVLTQALTAYAGSGLVGFPTFVQDKSNLMVLYGGPMLFVCYANYSDPQKCIEATHSAAAWLRTQEWGQLLPVYVKVMEKHLT